MAEENTNPALQQKRVENVTNNILSTQDSAYDFILNVEADVKPGGSALGRTQRSRQIGDDANFKIVSWTGSYQLPTHQIDPGDPSGPLILIPPGTIISPTLRVQIFDRGRGNSLTDFVPLQNIISPGVETEPLRMVYYFTYTMRRSTNLDFDFVNTAPADPTDKSINVLHVSLSLKGIKLDAKA